MAYFDDITAEVDINNAAGRPGRPAINRTSSCFIAGQQAAYWGWPRSHCPHNIEGAARQNWLAGFDDEQKAAFNRERFERNREANPGKW